MSRPAPEVVGAPPADLGAAALRIPTPARGYVAGWLTRGRPGAGAVLLLHPVRANRRAMLGRARFLHAAGYTVLLVDLPAHGESPGAHVTFGARESVGARAAMAYLRHATPGERVGVLGISLGGAALLLGDGPPAATSADAVVLEMVYPDIRDAVADRLRIRLGVLGPPLAPLLTWQLGPRLGLRAADLRPIARVGAVRAPVLMIAGDRDRHTPPVETRALYARVTAPKALWLVPGAAHEDLHAAAPTAYETRVLQFFGAHLRAAAPNIVSPVADASRPAGRPPTRSGSGGGSWPPRPGVDCRAPRSCFGLERVQHLL